MTGTAGDWWDIADHYAEDIGDARRLLLVMGRSVECDTFNRAAAGIGALQRLHRLGRPVCVGDTGSEVVREIRIDPMGKQVP